TSNMAERARRIFAAVKTNPRATAGMIMCLNVPEPCTGSHCKFTAKMSISMMPSQKLGVASPRLANTLQKLSSQVLTRTADRIPRNADHDKNGDAQEHQGDKRVKQPCQNVPVHGVSFPLPPDSGLQPFA